jgi:hypothetical protein
MPNWVWNKLTVLGSESDVDAFVAKARGQRAPYQQQAHQSEARHAKLAAEEHALTFDSFVRVPDDVRFGSYSSGGYNWQINNWSTKWEAGDLVCTRESKHAVTYLFQTAWCPAYKVIAAMIEQHPECVVVNSWYEEDCSYGRTTGVLGAVTEVLTKEAEGMRWDEFFASTSHDEDTTEGEGAYFKYRNGLKRVYYDAHEEYCATHKETVK